MEVGALRFVFQILVAGGLAWIVGAIVGVSVSAFDGASDTVKAASIAALVSIFSVFLGRYFEQEREAKRNANNEKVEVYRRFFDFYFVVMGNPQFVKTPTDPDWIAKEMIAFQRELTMWGSDKVIKSYVRFRKDLSNFSQDANAPETELAVRLAKPISSAAALLREMRKDLGYRFSSFSGEELALFQIAENDPNYEALIAEIKSLKTY